MKKILILLFALISFSAFSQVKISSLPNANSFNGTEKIEIVQSGSSKQGTLNQFRSFFFPLYSGTTIKYLSDSAGYFSWRTVSGGGGSSTWGGITGAIFSQTDLQSALNLKYNTPTGTISQYIRGDGTLATYSSGGGGTTYNYLTKSANYTATSLDKFIECTGTITITLPTAVGVATESHKILNNGTGVITVLCTGGTTVSVNIKFSTDAYEFISNGTNWKIY